VGFFSPSLCAISGPIVEIFVDHLCMSWHVVTHHRRAGGVKIAEVKRLNRSIYLTAEHFALKHQSVVRLSPIKQRLKRCGETKSADIQRARFTPPFNF
jgi:hypothetical protein